MIFAKLDVSVYSHPRFVAAGYEAVGYWAMALAYLRHQESGDGFLPAHSLRVPLGGDTERCLRLCEELAVVGLFIKAEGGYFLKGYAEKNETRDVIESRMKVTRDRKARLRKALSHRTDEGSGTRDMTVDSTRDKTRDNRVPSRVPSDSDSDSDSVSASDSSSLSSGSGSVLSGSSSGALVTEIPTRAPAPAGARGETSLPASDPPGPSEGGGRRPLPSSERGVSGQAWLAAFTEGVSELTGRPCTAGRMYLGTLERIVAHHAPDRAAPAACAWIRDEAKAFARKWDGKHPPKGLTPDGLERWLNEGRQGPPEFGKPRIVQLPPEEWHEDDWSDLGATVLR